MEWVYLEGINRVNVSYKVWRQTRRTLRTAKKENASKQSLKFLKEDVEYEYDELIDAILSLQPSELNDMLRTVKSDRLYQLIQANKNWREFLFLGWGITRWRTLSKCSPSTKWRWIERPSTSKRNAFETNGCVSTDASKTRLKWFVRNNFGIDLNTSFLFL